MRIILGTAHLKSTPGKRSPDGVFREYQYSREICRRIKKALIMLGYDCIIDYEEDDMIGASSSSELSKRVKIVNNECLKYGASNCLYISIHNNAASNGKWSSARGLTVYAYTNGSPMSKRFAKILYEEGVKLGLKGNRSTPLLGYWTDNFYILKNTKCPAVLTENLFQDNKEDVAFLQSETGKDIIVKYHINGILRFLKEYNK